MRIRNRAISTTAGAALVVAAMVFGGGISAQGAEPHSSVSVSDYSAYLESQIKTNTDASTTLLEFTRLSGEQQVRFVEIISERNLFSELTVLADSDAAQLSTSSSVSGLDSALYPDAVTYRTESSVAASEVVKGMASPLGYYGDYTTATGTATYIQSLFGIQITKLNVWVTFNTAYAGVPVKVLSHGSSSSNLNLLVNISSTNNPAYIASGGLAVASTTWHGCALFQGLGACFDKLQTAKFYSGGLYTHTVVNA